MNPSNKFSKQKTVVFVLFAESRHCCSRHDSNCRQRESRRFYQKIHGLFSWNCHKTTTSFPRLFSSFCSIWQKPVVGFMGVGRGQGNLGPLLDFQIFYFPIKFLAKIYCSLSFERVKWNFTMVAPLGKNSFSYPWKNPLLAQPLEKILPTPIAGSCTLDSSKDQFIWCLLWCSRLATSYGAPFLKILYLTDLTQKLLSLRIFSYLCAEIAKYVRI